MLTNENETSTKLQISENIEEVEDKISDIVAEKNVKYIKEHFKSLSIGEGSFL